MSENPTLRAILDLDATQFAAQIDTAKAKANSFDSQLGTMRTGLGGVSRSMQGLASAAGTTSGAFGGAARALSGFLSLVKAEPIYAIATALILLTKALSTYVENTANAALERTKKQIEEYKKLKAVLEESNPETFGKTPIGRAEYQAKNESSSRLVELVQSEKKIIEQQTKIVEAKDSSGKGFAAGANDPVWIERQQSMARLKIYEEELASRAAKKKEAEDKAAADEKKSAEEFRDANAKRIKGASEDRAKVALDEERAKEKIEKKKKSIEDDYQSKRASLLAGGAGIASPVADSMARMGGYFGSQVDPNSRSRDLQQRLVDLNRETLATLREIRDGLE